VLDDCNALLVFLRVIDSNLGLLIDAVCISQVESDAGQVHAL